MGQTALSPTFFTVSELEEVIDGFSCVNPEATIQLLRDVAKSSRFSDSDAVDEIRNLLSDRYNDISSKVDEICSSNLCVVWRLGQLAGYIGFNEDAKIHVQRSIDMAKECNDRGLVHKATHHLKRLGR